MNVVVTEERPNPVARLSNSIAAFAPALSKAGDLLSLVVLMRRCRESSSKLLIASRALGLDVDCDTNGMEGIKCFLRAQLIHTACCMCYRPEALESA